MENGLGKQELPRYLRVYNYYKELILSGQLQADIKLPSIRKGAMQLEISRTTMEAAYQILAAEGYIIAKPQSGYYVTDIAQRAAHTQKLSVEPSATEEKLYDFRTANVDKDSFKFDLWRRYMKSALRQDDRLFSYGEPQGEYEFREVLAEYLQKNRNVLCTPRQIVIGAGIQSLLHILCPLIKEKKGVYFVNQDFQQGKAVFEDYGFNTIKENELEEAICYISPSSMSRFGGVLSVRERLRLIEEAKEKRFLVIEDDYNNEFSYFHRQIPSIQGLAGGKNVVYVGTFSKMLLPSIRMSFMVLPMELLEAYEARKHFYNQTASKAEQIAITQFIRDGHLTSQIRKSRKTHLAKASEFAEMARNIFPNAKNVQLDEAGFCVLLKVYTNAEPKEVESRAKERGVLVRAFQEMDEKGIVTLMLQCTNMSNEQNVLGLIALKECFEEVLDTRKENSYNKKRGQ